MTLDKFLLFEQSDESPMVDIFELVNSDEYATLGSQYAQSLEQENHMLDILTCENDSTSQEDGNSLDLSGDEEETFA